MPPYNKADFISLASRIAANQNETLANNLQAFLKFAYDYPVVLNKKGGVTLASATTPKDVASYLTALLKGYFKKRESRVTLNDVRTIPDPAVDAVLENFAEVKPIDLSVISKHHRLSMAAENKVGDLLELYLAEQLEPKGWFWCCCNIIKGVDFFKPGSPVTLLQVKNRDNSENSSSEQIRDLLLEHGCPVKIQKWHRCVSKTGVTCWENFPGNGGEKFLTEAGFREFLRDYPKN